LIVHEDVPQRIDSHLTRAIEQIDSSLSVLEAWLLALTCKSSAQLLIQVYLPDAMVSLVRYENEGLFKRLQVCFFQHVDVLDESDRELRVNFVKVT
jgi:hypothetical protein